MPRTARGAITLAEEQPRSAGPAAWLAGLVVVVLAVIGTAAVLGVRRTCRALVSGEQCLVTASGSTFPWAPDQASNAAAITAIAAAARDAAAGRDHRDRDRDAGVEGAQRQVRRPRLARPVPAAALAGLGHGRADPRPRVLDEQVLRRPGEGRGLRVDGHRRGRAGGAALRGGRGLRPARGAGPGDRVGAVGPDPRRPGVRPRGPGDARRPAARSPRWSRRTSASRPPRARAPSP